MFDSLHIEASSFSARFGLSPWFRKCIGKVRQLRMSALKNSTRETIFAFEKL